MILSWNHKGTVERFAFGQTKVICMRKLHTSKIRKIFVIYIRQRLIFLNDRELVVLKSNETG